MTPLFAGLLGGEMNFDRFFQEVTAIVIHKCGELFWLVIVPKVLFFVLD